MIELQGLFLAPIQFVMTMLFVNYRKSFSKGYVIEKSQLAFSQPSSDGQALASNYIGTRSFLVYKTGNLCC